MSFRLRRGTAPLLVSMPHIGTDIPAPLRAGYVERATAIGTPSSRSSATGGTRVSRRK